MKPLLPTIACCAALGLAPAAGAMCDVIPGARVEFRGALGSVDRPYAIPGDVGQQVALGLDLSGCDSASPGFQDLGGASGPEDDHFVSVVFKPPAGGARNAVVLTTLANEPTCLAKVAAAGPLPGGGSARCQVVAEETQQLDFLSDEVLTFRFPDTDADFSTGPSEDDDDRTYTGPAAIAVTSVASDLPLGLASARCADTPGLVACVDELYTRGGVCQTRPDVDLDPVFSHFSALPPANDYGALCTTPDECEGTGSELRMTVDADGNLLIPLDWRGVLLRPDGVPVARLVRGALDIDAFPDAPFQPLAIPGRSFLASFNPGGVRLPPIFTPIADPSSPGDLSLFGTVDAPVGVIRVGRRSPDLSAPGSPSFGECTGGGANDGLPCRDAGDCPGGTCGATACHVETVETPTACSTDAECAGASCVSSTCRLGGFDTGLACGADADCQALTDCGPSLFRFESRLASGSGPVVVAEADYVLEAEDPVPIEGLLESDALFAFVELEPIAALDPITGKRTGLDLNGDGDDTDPVVVLRDAASGEIQPIGPSGSPGRAVARVRRDPFSFSAVAVEGGVLAFLEPEPLQGDCTTPASCIQNADNDLFDSLLRVYALGTSTELTDPLAPLAVEAEPRIDGRSLVVSSGRVYFRVDEADGALQKNRLVSRDPTDLDAVDSAATARLLTPDGRNAGFSTDATNVVSGQSGDFNVDAFVRDRDADGDGRYDELTMSLNTMVSVDDLGDPPGLLLPGVTSIPRSSTPEGRAVVLTSTASNLVPFDTNAVEDVFVHDRDVDADGVLDELGAISTRRVGIADPGSAFPCAEGDGASTVASTAAISADGRFVVFESEATNLVDGDTNGPGADGSDVFVHDRDADEDGIFDEQSSCLPGKVATRRISVTDLGGQAVPGGFGGSRAPAISADGRFVAFTSDATNLAAGTTAPRNLFVHDRDVDGDGVFDEPGAIATRLVGISSGGEPANALVEAQPAISADGRFVSFRSLATNLVAGDTNGTGDVFVHDRDADEDGLFDEPGGVSTVLASVASSGAQGQAALNLATSPQISPDGRFVAFTSVAGGLVPYVSACPPPPADCRRAFVHDRLLGLTRTLSVSPTHVLAGGHADVAGISGDGRWVTFTGNDDGLVGPGEVGSSQDQVYVHGPDPMAPDLNGDGDHADTLLYVFDTNDASPVPEMIAEAGQVSVADGSAAFLAPDGSVMLWVDGSATLQDLGVDATALELSGTWLAALVPSGAGDEAFVWIYDWTAPGPSGTQLLPAAADFRLDGQIVAFREADGSLHVHDAATPQTRAIGETAVDYVVRGNGPGTGIVAFRTDESLAGTNLNGIVDPELGLIDADQDDVVLRVWDVETATLIETRQAALACRLEACDPRTPYRISARTVTFITLEADQGGLDLDGDGRLGIVQQTFPVDEALALASPVAPGCVDTLASLATGLCTDTAGACSSDGDCPAGLCFLPPGGCIEQTATACAIDDVSSCGAGQFCAPLAGMPGVFRCFDKLAGSCESDADCPGAALCQDEVEDRVRIFNPLAERGAGVQAFVAAARLASLDGAACSSDADCTPPEACNEAGRCQEPRDELVIAGAADADQDGIIDPLDNCPNQHNPDQLDSFDLGAGDACLLPEPGATTLLLAGIGTTWMLRRHRVRSRAGSSTYGPDLSRVSE